MKTMIYSANVLSGLLAVGLLAATDNVQASSSFSSQSTIAFDSSNLADGLAVVASYQPADPGFSYIFEAEGSIGEILPAPNNSTGIPSLGLGVEHTFAVNGYASAGSFTSHHVGWYQIDFTNDSLLDQEIALTLNYALHSVTEGDADSEVILDFSDESTLLGNVFFNNGLLNVEAYDPGVAIAFDNSGMTYTFTLGQGQAKSFYVDVAINGVLEPAAVPLPAAVWSFLVGLVSILGVKKAQANQNRRNSLKGCG